MRQEQSHATECDTCSRVAALRLKAEPIGRLVGKTPPQSTEIVRSPRENAASEWHAEAGAFLRREMADHAKCDQCGILMGPGHIEAAGESLCRTCLCRAVPGAVNDTTEKPRSTIGRRGWHSDYGVER